MGALYSELVMHYILPFFVTFHLFSLSSLESAIFPSFPCIHLILYSFLLVSHSLSHKHGTKEAITSMKFVVSYYESTTSQHRRMEFDLQVKLQSPALWD